MEISLTHESDWRAVVAQLPDVERLAKEHKQVEVQYGNAKITTGESLLRFILLHVGANLPLRQTVALMESAGGPRVSAMRLHMKMRRARPFLHALVEGMVRWTAAAQSELWAGYTMTLIDATVVCGPGATGTDTRIHAKMRAADVAILDAIVTDKRGGESFRNFLFKPGELAIADRAYCNANGIASVLEQGADVLVRYNRGALPVFEGRASKPLDVLARIRRISKGEVLDLPVSFVHGDDEKIVGRLIALRLPNDEAELARERLRKEQGSRVTEESLEAAGYTVLFTTVPRDRMNAVRCLDAYRLRWQIELQFKRWKSLCGFDRLPNYRDDTMIAWLYAKLLLGLVLDRMSSIRGELSPPVQLASTPTPPRKPRRRRTVASDGAAAMEGDEPSLSAATRRAPTAVTA